MSAFTCTLCNKSYSRHPEYEAHISSYDHQHRKRLQDLKQLSRDPNAAEKARRAERKADAEAGLRVIGTNENIASTGTGAGSGGGGGFKKGGFKSSFTAVKGPAAPTAPIKKNVLGDDEDDDVGPHEKLDTVEAKPRGTRVDAESDTDEEYAEGLSGGGYYDPRRPTGCFAGCPGARDMVAS